MHKSAYTSVTRMSMGSPSLDEVYTNAKQSMKMYPSGHLWTLLKRYASESLENCNETFYDKTKTLNDYKIRTNAVALPPRLYIDYNKTGLERYTGEEGKLTQCIFNFLNASAEDVPYDGDDHVGFFDANGTYSGMLADVYTGRVDLGLTGRYLIHMWKSTLSDFFASADICFVVKSRGYIPQWMSLATLLWCVSC